MIDCSQVLGIEPEATLVEIKRAYARALKANRPDDDPEAFGRVHAAFEACVARFKRRQAGLDDEEDWFDDEADSYAGGVPLPPELVAVETPFSAQVEEDFESPEPAAHDEVGQAVNSILEAAAQMSVPDFHTWLRSDERLYGLAFKRDVGDRVIESASRHAHTFGSRAMAAIHEFFEVDSISDPRLRHDFEARQVWLQVQADGRFHRILQKVRGPYSDFTDRTVFAELLDPPDRKRHLKMHLIPLLSGQIRKRFKELSAEDPMRTEAALSPQARDYWLPLTDPEKLHPRRLALALIHCLMVSFPFGLVLTASNFAWSRLLTIWGGIAGIIFAIWLGGALLSFIASRYSSWRIRTVGTGEAPAGANIFADKPTALAVGGAMISLGIAALALRLDKTTLGLIVQVWLVMLMAFVVFKVPRFRWEAFAAVAATTVVAYPYFRALGSAELEDAFLAVGPGAFSAGVLSAVLVDALHARFMRQALSDVRDLISVPQCVLAVIAALVVWLR